MGGEVAAKQMQCKENINEKKNHLIKSMAALYLDIIKIAKLVTYLFFFLTSAAKKKKKKNVGKTSQLKASKLPSNSNPHFFVFILWLKNYANFKCSASSIFWNSLFFFFLLKFQFKLSSLSFFLLYSVKKKKKLIVKVTSSLSFDLRNI